ncbi:MAG TPA: nucleotide exchange factor GrpE [Pyrinomonadaceae bacterium]
MNRIPISFIDDEDAPRDEDREDGQEASDHPVDETGLTPDELGRQSSYEDETEIQRRIDRGDEDESRARRDDADDADTAGGPPVSDLPESREDQDETGAGPVREMQSDDEEMGWNAPPPRVAEAHGPAVAELVATRAELKRIEAERTELLDRLARRQADFDNYRKRLERERGEMYSRTVGEVVGKLLPVLDNLRRALEAETSLEADESEEFRRFLHGVELIYKQLNDALEGLGLEPVEAVGHRFDPHVHEAVATEASDEFEPDTVTQEIVRGYRLGEKLLRPAMVKVATKE